MAFSGCPGAGGILHFYSAPCFQACHLCPPFLDSGSSYLLASYSANRIVAVLDRRRAIAYLSLDTAATPPFPTTSIALAGVSGVRAVGAQGRPANAVQRIGGCATALILNVRRSAARSSTWRADFALVRTWNVWAASVLDMARVMRACLPRSSFNPCITHLLCLVSLRVALQQ